LIAAIAYTQGQSTAEIEETFGFSKKDVYLRLDRFEERELHDALYDEPKPGRPPKLTGDQLAELETVLQESKLPDPASRSETSTVEAIGRRRESSKVSPSGAIWTRRR